MFCNHCGASLPDGSKFCTGCGNAIGAAATAPQAGQAESKKKDRTGAGGFFSSGAGIALIIILAVAVAAGITFGVIMLVKSGADNEVDAATVKVWDEYESLLETESESVPEITLDTAALTRSQEELKKSQEKVALLEKALKETAGTSARRTSNVKGRSVRDVKADQLAAALVAYTKYIQKMTELFTTLVGANLLDPNVVARLNQILSEIQKLGGTVKVLSNTFLKDNTKVVTIKIDPPFLKFAADASPELQKSVAAAQAAEQQRLAAEKAAADQQAAAAAAAAEAERQRQAAEEASQHIMVRVPRVSDPCGDPNCDICYTWAEQ
jgi:hypothetical protein